MVPVMLGLSWCKAPDKSSDPSGRADTEAPLLGLVQLPRYVAAEIDPSVIEFQPLALGDDQALMLDVPVIDVDFISWRSCPLDGRTCLTGETDRRYRIFASLPIGRQKLQARFCMRADRSSTKKDACSPWSKEFNYTQNPWKDRELRDLLRNDERIFGSFRSLAKNIHKALGELEKESSQCSKPDSAPAAKTTRWAWSEPGGPRLGAAVDPHHPA